MIVREMKRIALDEVLEKLDPNYKAFDARLVAS